MRTPIVTAAFLFTAPLIGGLAAHAEEVLMLDSPPSVEELRGYLAPPRRTRSIEIPSAAGRPAMAAPQAQMASLAGPAAPQAAPREPVAAQPLPQPQFQSQAQSQPDAPPPAAPVTIGYHVQFAYDSAAILAGSRPFLDRLAQAMRQEPALRLVVEGHTDAYGGDAYNMALSQRRAEAVKAYLGNHAGIDPARLEAVGKGKSEPLTADPFAAENRRVQFRPVQSAPAS